MCIRDRQKSVNLHSFGKRSSNWVFTVSLGGMSKISDKNLPCRLRCGPSALYSGFRNLEVALKLAFSTPFFFEKEGQESLWVTMSSERWWVSVVKACTFDINFVHVGLRLGSSPVRALASGRGHGRCDNFLGNLTRGRRRASGRKRSFTSILELESFVQVKELYPFESGCCNLSVTSHRRGPRPHPSFSPL